MLGWMLLICLNRMWTVEDESTKHHLILRKSFKMAKLLKSNYKNIKCKENTKQFLFKTILKKGGLRCWRFAGKRAVSLEVSHRQSYLSVFCFLGSASSWKWERARWGKFNDLSPLRLVPIATKPILVSIKPQKNRIWVVKAHVCVVVFSSSFRTWNPFTFSTYLFIALNQIFKTWDLTSFHILLSFYTSKARASFGCHELGGY